VVFVLCVECCYVGDFGCCEVEVLGVVFDIVLVDEIVFVLYEV